MTTLETTAGPATDPADRAQVIVHSLRAYTHAWLGFIPIVGMVYCVTALVWALQAGREEREIWNPARRYRFASFWIAGFAGLAWLAIDTLLLLWALSRLA